MELSVPAASTPNALLAADAVVDPVPPLETGTVGKSLVPSVLHEGIAPAVPVPVCERNNLVVVVFGANISVSFDAP